MSLRRKLNRLDEIQRRWLAIGCGTLSAFLLAIAVVRLDGFAVTLLLGALFLFAVAGRVGRPQSQTSPSGEWPAGIDHEV